MFVANLFFSLCQSGLELQKKSLYRRLLDQFKMTLAGRITIGTLFARVLF